jgi:hypothetical protein
MNYTNLKFLKPDKCKILRMIKINGIINKIPFIIFLPYLRKYEIGKRNSTIFDALDENILSSIKLVYPDSALYYNEDIMFEGKLEERLNQIPKDKIKEIKFVISPNIDFIGLPTEERIKISNYTMSLMARVHNCERLDFIINLFDFEISVNDIELKELMKTIEPI